MTTDEMKQKIKSAMLSETPNGIEVFCYLDDGETRLKKFKINDTLRDNINVMLKEAIKNKFLNDDTLLDVVENISDNHKVLYEVPSSEEYNPFSILETYNDKLSQYSEDDQEYLKGFVFRINTNENAFWVYQHIYQMRMVKRSKSLYAMFSNNTYVPLNHDVLKIDSRVDILIIDGNLVTSNIGLLQQNFGFEMYVRNEAAKTINIIESFDLVTNIEKIRSFESKEKLTNAKKLLKAKNSLVLNLARDVLIKKISVHPRYKDKFKIEDNKIVLNSLKDVNELIKMLNDNIVRSELTDQEYESPSKYMLEPLVR